MTFILLLLFSYLLGSVSFAFLFTFFLAGKDIRTMGDGNPGAANVARQVGKKWGILVWLGDTLKAMLAMSVARFFGVQAVLFLAFIGTAAIIGHCYPVFLRFKGGKGAATTGGALFYLAPQILPVVIAFWFIAQKTNPRDMRIVLPEIALYFVFLYFLYPQNFGALAAATVLFIAIGLLVNPAVVREILTSD